MDPLDPDPAVVEELLKLLVEVAWCDHELHPDEVAHIRGIAKKVLKSTERLAAVDAWLARDRRLPPPDLSVLRRNAEETMKASARVMTADRKIVEDEKEFARVLAEVLAGKKGS
jgi:uncharacterized tellurite resistance protein B-like protein